MDPAAAREKNGQDAGVNRALARLLEKEGHFKQAIQLWELVRKAAPHDGEAQDKARELAASETIARGNYDQVTAEDPTERDDPAKHGGAEAEEESTEVGSEADPYLEKAAEHWCADRFAEARAVLEEGVAAIGPVFELTLALAELEIEPLRRSLARTEEKLRKRPKDEKLEKSRGELTAQINARELACFRRRAEHDPADAASRMELGVRLLRRSSGRRDLRAAGGAVRPRAAMEGADAPGPLFRGPAELGAGPAEL